MVKIKIEDQKMIKLQKGNKIIERNIIDFKPVQDVVKEEKVVQLKPKKRKTRKKKDESVNIDED